MPNSLTPAPRLTPAHPASAALFVLTLAPEAQETPEAVFSRLATALNQRDGTVAALFVYGALSARDAVLRVMRRYLGPVDWPVLWVEGRSCHGAALAGVQAFATSETEVERVLVNGRIVGTVFRDGGARHCLLAGVGPDDPAATPAVQTGQTFANLQHALAGAGFDTADLARTWFYNANLLRWYDTFNQVRTAHYAQHPFRSGCVPASTGVDGRNPAGAALALAAWAVQPTRPDAKVRDVASPLQCAASCYGSSFSRAVELTGGAVRHLLVSGTASIAPGGESLWRGDIVRQIATTMEVVEALLTSRGMRWADVVRATTYFKYPLDAAAFEAWQAAHGVRLPAIAVHCDICRDDLLFEIEVDAGVEAGVTPVRGSAVL